MKRIIRNLTVFALAIAMLTTFSAVWAQCGTSVLVANYATGGQLDVPGTLDDGSGSGTIMTHFWIQGQSAAHNSGTLATIYQALPWSTDSYFVWSDWGNGGVYGDCPPENGRTVFTYSIENGGNGEYILLSSNFSSYYYAWDFDAVTNGNGSFGPNTMTPSPIPAMTVASQSVSNGVQTLNVTWPAIQNLKGFYDTDPGTNLITGVAIRYYQGSSAPADFKTGSWNLAAVVNFGANGNDPGQATVQVPDNSNVQTYVAMTVLFDGGQPGGFTETSFVGATTLVPAAQTPDPVVFDHVTAEKVNRAVKVSWSMTSEPGVRSYQVLASKKAAGPFTQTGYSVDAGGDYSVYVVNSHVSYFRVAAVLGDGSQVLSEVAEAGKASPGPAGIRSSK